MVKPAIRAARAAGWSSGSAEHERGDLAHGGLVGMGKGDQGPFRVEPGRALVGIVGPRLRVEHGQHRQVAALAAELLEQAGAHEGGIDRAVQQCVDHAVLVLAHRLQHQRRRIDAGVLELQRLGREGAEEVRRRGGDALAAQVGEAAQPGGVAAHQDDAAELAHGLRTRPVELGGDRPR